MLMTYDDGTQAEDVFFDHDLDAQRGIIAIHLNFNPNDETSWDWDLINYLITIRKRCGVQAFGQTIHYVLNGGGAKFDDQADIPEMIAQLELQAQIYAEAANALRRFCPALMGVEERIHKLYREEKQANGHHRPA